MLDDHLSARGRGDHLSLCYGVDQEDTETLRAILDQTLRDRQIDLVIDGASHYHDEIKASFDVIFPRIGSGRHLTDRGLELVADRCSHDDLFRGSASVANTMVEMLAIADNRPDVIPGIRLNHGALVITRGPPGLAPELSVERMAANRGAPIAVAL